MKNKFFIIILILFPLTTLSNQSDFFLCKGNGLAGMTNWGNDFLIELKENNNESILLKEKHIVEQVHEYVGLDTKKYLEVLGKTNIDPKYIIIEFDEDIEKTYKALEIEKEIVEVGGSKIVIDTIQPSKDNLNAFKCNFISKAEIKINRFDLEQSYMSFSTQIKVEQLNSDFTSEEKIKFLTKEEIEVEVNTQLFGAMSSLNEQLGIPPPEILESYISPSPFSLCRNNCLSLEFKKENISLVCKRRKL